MTTTTIATPDSWQYLRRAGFDHFFIWGIPLVAAFSVALVLARPDLLEAVILLDLSLLGYHHVIATFTRLKFDAGSARENRILLLYLPPLVLAVVAGLTLLFGVVAVTTLYLHWQWWHYTRQSEGISKAYTMKSGSSLPINPQFHRFVFYAVPVSTFLSMAARNPETFLFQHVYTLPVSHGFADVSLVVAMAVVSVWVWQMLRGIAKRQVAPLLLTYFFSHFLIYAFAYHFIHDVTIGWLLINIWHNFQYVLFVWACNVNDFGMGKRKAGVVRAWFCRPTNWFVYFSACILATWFFYRSLDAFIQYAATPATMLPLMVVLYQTINFHHYVVDSRIWKLRRKPVRDAVGLE